MATPYNPSIGVKRTLRKLGEDIRAARLVRNLPADVVATRARTSRPTLGRIEKGDPSVGIGIYAAVLQALGMMGRLANVADLRDDEEGLALALEDLPRRARTSRPRKAP